VTTSRLVFAGGAELRLSGNAWHLTTAVGPETRVPSVEATVKQLEASFGPCVLTTQLEGNFDLVRNAQGPLGLQVTEANSLLLDRKRLAPEIPYGLGSATYHLERLVNAYADHTRAFRETTQIPGFGELPVRCSLGGCGDIYFEFDALITAVRKAFDLSRFHLWNHFGKGRGIPSNFHKTVDHCPLPDELKQELKGIWSAWGVPITEYRDCIQHYTPLDRSAAFGQVSRVADLTWSLLVRIPDNPESRSSSSFTFAQDLDALCFARGAVDALFAVMMSILRRTC
jgi:hypothetical protein